MTSPVRSAGSVACIVLATLSMLAALITAIVALTATSHVSDKLEPTVAQGYYKSVTEYEPFEDSACPYQSGEEPPDQDFWNCIQKDSVAWSAQVAARQADVQAKGNLAIIFGLFGLTFAVCAVALNPRWRSAAQTAAPSKDVPHPGAGEAGVPAQSRPSAGEQRPGTPGDQRPEPPAPPL
ncbi:hypothetical protein G4Z16_09380 [Streptomyces bathyalis]|uniref:Uncharacterized protein n=1 Tax=Streptomyces bathyalis TaxID=2710756 RepID=A0A7T1T559_9ACTN|nr:hypothetical protein [Streptomyces bathyalis]QPP06576.1 hypothetical protein G4Z16_09380 [Streptomyces bathyalis]